MVNKKPGDKKIGGIKSSVVKPTDTTGEVTGADSVSEVGEVRGVKAASSVSGPGKAGAIGKRRSTRTMTMEEREELFKMVSEEADKLFADSKMSAQKKKIITDAVKMAMDSGIIPEDKK